MQNFKLEACKKYPIGRMMIFGSVARGEQRDDSDVDVCIEPTTIIDYFMLAELQQQLMELCGTKVDLLTMHDRMSPELKKAIERDAIYV